MHQDLWTGFGAVLILQSPCRDRPTESKAESARFPHATQPSCMHSSALSTVKGSIKDCWTATRLWLIPDVVQRGCLLQAAHETKKETRRLVMDTGVAHWHCGKIRDYELQNI